MKRLIALSSTFVLLLALGSCKPPAEQKQTDTTVPASSPQVSLTDKYWKLIELNGQPITTDSGYTKEPHLIFNVADTSVRGNGGCNGFGGKYELQDGNRIKMSKLISTMMACEKIQVENEYFKALEAADNYVLHGDTLVLNRARMAPLARFVVASPK